MRRQTVTVRFGDRSTLEVEGYRVPGSFGTLVAHRAVRADGRDDGGRWVVTHAPTGVGLPGRFTYLRDAAAYGKAVAALPLPWETDDATVLAARAQETENVGAILDLAGAHGVERGTVRLPRRRVRFEPPPLPEGWDWYDDPLDGDLECPCGHRIEPDGVCPNGHEAPVLV